MLLSSEVVKYWSFRDVMWCILAWLRPRSCCLTSLSSAFDTMHLCFQCKHIFRVWTYNKRSNSKCSAYASSCESTWLLHYEICILSVTILLTTKINCVILGIWMTVCDSQTITNVTVSELNKNPVEGFSAGLIDDNDIYRWEVLIIGPPDTL